MKKDLIIKSKDFINWFFYSGSDQDQKREALDLGYSVIQGLLDGSVTISPQKMLDGCESVVIPLNIVEGFEDEDTFDEIHDAITDGRISENFLISLT